MPKQLNTPRSLFRLTVRANRREGFAFDLSRRTVGDPSRAGPNLWAILKSVWRWIRHWLCLWIRP